jgi:hypothetical protein
VRSPTLIDKLKNRCPDCKGTGGGLRTRPWPNPGNYVDRVSCSRCRGSGELSIKTQKDGRFWTVKLLWFDFRRWLSLEVKRLGEDASKRIWP